MTFKNSLLVSNATSIQEKTKRFIQNRNELETIKKTKNNIIEHQNISTVREQEGYHYGDNKLPYDQSPLSSQNEDVDITIPDNFYLQRNQFSFNS
jgi:hypothetical protein